MTTKCQCQQVRPSPAVKLSVSVPHDLWEAARTAAGESSPSAIVQWALCSLLAMAEDDDGFLADGEAMIDTRTTLSLAYCG